MASKPLNKIFLSASIPSPDRDRQFFDTADIIAIRDAVRALAAVVIPKAHLVWGGHPAITPLIRYVMERMDADIKQHVTLYQSDYFSDSFPDDNFAFEDIRITERAADRELSLYAMRKAMLTENSFAAGIFIGGMEGIWDEYNVFREHQPNGIIIPVASTGGASLQLYNEFPQWQNVRLKTDYAYMALFRDLLSDYIK